MSSHYFIGKRLNPYETQKLETSLSYVLRKNSFLPKEDSTKDFMTSFIYLGYLEDKVAYDLLNLLDPYILSIAQNTAPTKCVFKQFELIGNKSTHKNLSIPYESENKLIHNVIMPYLQYAVETILDEEHKELLGFEPNVNLVKIRNKFLSQFRNTNKIIKENDVEILPNYFIGKPQNKGKEQFFMFDSIDVIKGKPEELKSGFQSKTDRLILDTIRSVPLTASKTNIAVLNNNGNSVKAVNGNHNQSNLNNNGSTEEIANNRNSSENQRGNNNNGSNANGVRNQGSNNNNELNNNSSRNQRGNNTNNEENNNVIRNQGGNNNNGSNANGVRNQRGNNTNNEENNNVIRNQGSNNNNELNNNSSRNQRGNNNNGSNANGVRNQRGNNNNGLNNNSSRNQRGNKPNSNKQKTNKTKKNDELNDLLANL